MMSLKQQWTCIFLVWFASGMLLLAIHNFKFGNISAGIILLLYMILTIKMLVDYIKHYKSERPEEKG